MSKKSFIAYVISLLTLLGLYWPLCMLSEQEANTAREFYWFIISFVQCCVFAGCALFGIIHFDEKD